MTRKDKLINSIIWLAVSLIVMGIAILANKP
jgi:hypothetical protein